MRLRSLRARLLAGVIALAAVCLIALGAIIYAQQRDFLLERVDEQAVSSAPLVGRVLDEQGVPRPQGDDGERHRGPGPRGGGPGGDGAGALSVTPASMRSAATRTGPSLELARDAVADARVTAPDRNIALQLSEVESVVSGDDDRLRQVVGNLVRNALVHTPSGSNVELAVGRAGDRVRLEVRDRGPGLPVPDGREMFERFWRAEPGRGRGAAGAGLGLAIVQGIVTAHGGDVRGETRPDGGAAFTVELPALD